MHFLLCIQLVIDVKVMLYYGNLISTTIYVCIQDTQMYKCILIYTKFEN